ncbi:MAG: DUF11 domain-containing protein [Proteobacteria bacterium]|nr:DUF11 domain-containing protein [Pseudomonadota bacterium]
MKTKLIMTLSVLSILGCYACSEDDSGTSSPQNQCSSESPFCEGNILHTCVNGTEQTETCSNQCSAEEGKCIDSSTPGQNCDAGKHYDEAKKGCVDDEIHTCDTGKHYDDTIADCVDDTPQCDTGKHFDSEKGECVEDEKCDEGKHFDADKGECVDDNECGEGKHFDADKGECVDDNECGDGKHFDADKGECVDDNECGEGKHFDAEKGECVDDGCDEGKHFDADKGECVDDNECGEGKHFDADKGECVDDGCDEGKHFDKEKGECVGDDECGEGKHFDKEKGECVGDDECGEGKHFDKEKGECVGDDECGEGKHFDKEKGECVSDEVDKKCSLGKHYDETSKKCIDVCNCGFIYDTAKGKCIEKDLFPGKSEYEKHQLALQETAMAFYRKGDNIQYETHRRSQYVTPETASSQHVEYLVCSGFVYAVFYQALGMELPHWTKYFTAYGKSFSGKNEDVVFFADGDGLKNRVKDAAAKTKFLDELLNTAKVQPGDAISYYLSKSDAGHVIFVYDLIKDDKGKITDAVILHSTSNFETKSDKDKKDRRTTKLDKSLSWHEAQNKDTGVHEGTVQKTLLSKIINGRGATTTEFIVIRPAAKDTSYKHITYSGAKAADYPNWEKYTTVKDTNYTIKEDTLCRMQYHDIEIEKTLDIHPGSTVEPGGEMTYTIDITNHSDKAYSDIYVTEKLSEHVDLKDAGKDGNLYNGTVAWFIPSIAAGKTHKISYTVTVKNDASLLGKKVISTGSVAQIKTKTIENAIAYNLSADQIKLLKNIFNLIAETGNYKGVDAVQKAYKDALDYDVPLKDMTLGSLYVDGTPSGVFKNYPKQVPYYNADQPNYDKAKNKALLISINGNSSPDNLKFNDQHDMAGMVLNHYYSGVHSTYDVNADKKIYTKGATPKYFEKGVNAPDSRTDRENMIYPETLRDGDILVYANAVDIKTDEKPVEAKGTHAFIYLDGKFQGINASGKLLTLSVKDGTAPKYYVDNNLGQVSMFKRFGNMPQMFGKDFYVILRPAMTLKKTK